MDYLAQRQAIISQNIANADTPGYRPQDLAEADFGAILGESSSSGVGLARTRPGHIAPGTGGRAGFEVEDDRSVWEVAPSGNAVVMEEQLIAASKTLTDYALATSLYQKQVGLVRTALGK